MSENTRSSFKGSLGFVLAAAGSAVGLGNIWRFPYLAAKDNGGFFIFVYIILALTFGFALLTTEIAIGRKTKQSPLTAYKKLDKKFGWMGSIATLVPVIILPYYCAIGGWVCKYLYTFATLKGTEAADDAYFGGFITHQYTPIIWMFVFIVLTGIVVIGGVNKGIEKSSRILMPILLFLIIGIAIFSLTLNYEAADGVTRTGLQGLKIYLIPDFKSLTFTTAFDTLIDAVGQLFFSISVAMGIMIAYGSYVEDDANLMKSINQIEIFDTAIALLAGLMIVPAVYVFMGRDGMTGGPGLMFKSLPKVFNEMGTVGAVIGIIFFITVLFAAVTSSVSIMEAIVSSIMDRFHLSRMVASLITVVYAIVFGLIVCLGYNKLYFELTLPNGSVGQILDVFDYISNNILMPFLALMTCILIGWIIKPKTIIDEVTKNGERFGRKNVYIVMIKFIAPIILFVLLIQSLNVF